MQVTTGFVTLNKAKIYYETTGSGKPLILLHSGIADRRMWIMQRLEFSRYFQVITPDFRGYGKTPPPDEPFRHYQDMYLLIQHLGFKSVNIVGCSLGGKVAMELAIAYSGLIDHLILVAPGLPGYEYQDQETLDKDRLLEKLIAGGKREEVADLLVDIWVVGLKRNRNQVSTSTRNLVQKMILENYASVVDRYPENKPEFDVISRLSDIYSPALVLVGDNDLPDMLAISNLISGQIPGAKRLVLPDAAHLPNLEHNQLFNQTIINFLNLYITE